MEAAELLDRLRRVRDLQFSASSEASTGWDGCGAGSVATESPDPGTVIFRESGLWQPTKGGELKFRNVYRWSLAGDRSLRLEHLRFGPAQPVHLFELAPESETLWSSIGPHRCGEDVYSARLEIQEEDLSLQWSIVGPRKREDVRYLYR